MKKLLVLGAFLLLLLVSACKASTDVDGTVDSKDGSEVENDFGDDEDEVNDEDEDEDDENEDDEDENDEDDEDENDDDDAAVNVEVGASAGIAMISKNFSYSPDALTAKVGEEMVLTITSEGFHDIVIDELGVSQKLEAGVNTVRFTPSKAGTFEFYCSVGTHRQSGMKGTIVVTE